MGLGTKIKTALHGHHGDSYAHTRSGSAGSYEDGRVPGSFPSDSVPRTTATGGGVPEKSKLNNGTTGATVGKTNAATDSYDGYDVNNATAANTNTTNGHSTLKKGGKNNRKTDSGIDFVDGPAGGYNSRRGSSSDYTYEGALNNHSGGLDDDYSRRPVSREAAGGIATLDDPKSSAKRTDPYWGNIKRSGYERDVGNNRPISQVDRDLNTVENGTYGTAGHGTTATGTSGAGGTGGTLGRTGTTRDAPMGLDNNVRSTNSGLNGLHNGSNGTANSRVDPAGLDYSATTGGGAYRDGSRGLDGVGNDTNGYGYGGSNTNSGAGLTTHGATGVNGNTATRNRDLHNVGLVDPREPVLGGDHSGGIGDDRWRARDKGFGPVTSNNHHQASALADQHHHEDLRDSGLHNNGSSGGGSGGVGGVVYGDSVRRSPTNGGRGGYGGNGTSPVNKTGGGPHSPPPSSSHFVPRVVHTCHSCGVDNDISQYFRPDVAYRLG